MIEIKFRAWIPSSQTMIGHREVIERAHLLFEGSLNSSDIVMQDTGLKDKNGVEIYDGDIIVFDSLPKVKVHIEWRKEDACFHFGNWYENCFPYTSTDATIIGNIYENPELLDKD